MARTRIRKIENSLGVILPKSFLEKTNLGEGDEVYLTQIPEGFRITRTDPFDELWEEAFRNLNLQYGNTLRALAR
jgi:putative addiction module antidote